MTFTRDVVHLQNTQAPLGTKSALYVTIGVMSQNQQLDASVAGGEIRSFALVAVCTHCSDRYAILQLAELSEWVYVLTMCAGFTGWVGLTPLRVAENFVRRPVCTNAILQCFVTNTMFRGPVHNRIGDTVVCVC